MERATITALSAERPQWTSFVELLKPITWFPPMWAFGCGVISSGQSLLERWPFALAGIDAINEPGRPIPSGRVPGRLGLHFAIAWTLLSLLVSSMLGTWVMVAAIVGLALAWAYSAPPLRLKQNGWGGNAAVGLCYEGLPWFTAAAAMAATLPDGRILALAGLYSLGAHGIMTLNDFKAIEGDRIMHVRSLPVQLGALPAARLACAVMALPQLIVTGLLLNWQAPVYAAIVGALVLLQGILMRRFLSDPVRFATWFSGFGVTLYVLGMLASAIAVRGVIT